MDSQTSLKLRFGVLAPGSNFVPRLAGDMLAALKFGLGESGLDADLIIESPGYNADIKMVVPTIQQLILTQRVNCLIAPLNVSVIEKISGYCESELTPLIALNMTEDALFETSLNPWVFVNSIYLWHAAWMSGYLAVQRFGAKGAAIVGIHEGGYNLMFAFQLGLEAAGGTLVNAAVTHRNSSTEDPTESIELTVAQEPDFIWIGHSGKEAVSFLNAYKAKGLKEKIPLITIPTTVSANIREAAGDAIDGVWYVDGENCNETGAMDNLTTAIGRPPNPYALLAYEAAHLLAAAVEKMDAKGDFQEGLREALKSAGFSGPRGTAGFNKDRENPDFYLRRVANDGDTIEPVTAPPLLFEQYQLARVRLAKEGWINPYLCA